MKKFLKLIIIIIIISLVTACEKKIDSQGAKNYPQPAQKSQSPMEPQGAEKTDPSAKNNVACLKALEELGQYSEREGKVDYQSGRRIFPLLQFIITKKSIPANSPEQSVFMNDNPIFVTRNDRYANSLVFSTIHSKRTGVLHGVTGFPDNAVTNYYEPMVFGSNFGYIPQVPSTNLRPQNNPVEVNRKTWANELKDYANICKDSLILPPTNNARPFFSYNGKIYPFSKEIDFVTGAEGVGFGLDEYGISYFNNENKIQIPILVYCPKGKVESVVMLQDGVELKFTEDKYNSDWQKWLGKDWHAFKSEKVDFDEKLFAKADFAGIHSKLPPFLSDNSLTVQLVINGEKVDYINQ